MCMSLCYFIYVVLALVLTAETEAITLFVCIVLCYVMNPTDVYVTDNRKKRSDYYMDIQKERECVCMWERKKKREPSVSQLFYRNDLLRAGLDWIHRFHLQLKTTSATTKIMYSFEKGYIRTSVSAKPKPTNPIHNHNQHKRTSHKKQFTCLFFLLSHSSTKINNKKNSGFYLSFYIITSHMTWQHKKARVVYIYTQH